MHNTEFRLFYGIGVLAVCCFTMVWPGCNEPEKIAVSGRQSLLSEFEHQIDSLRQLHRIAGLSYAIFEADTLLMSGAFGFSNLKDRIPATDTTPYRIASITKPVASTILIQLREEGKLKLTDPLIKHYPTWPEDFTRIRNYLQSEETEYLFLTDDYHPSDTSIQLIHHLTHTAQGVPGETFQYNGFLYGRLSEVVEAVTDSSFVDVIWERILRPLEMNRSLPQQRDPKNPGIIAEMALPYQYDPEIQEWTPSAFPDPVANAGAGMISTVMDLGRFDRAINQGTVLSVENVKEATTPYRLVSGETSNYGLGWFGQQTEYGMVVWHTGWQPGAYSGLYLKVPEKELTLILLANTEGLSAPFYPGLSQDITASDFALLFLTIMKKN